MGLSDFIDTSRIKFLTSLNKFQAIEELALVFDKSEICSDIKALISSLKEREEIMSTGIGFGIAIPHAKIEGIRALSFAVGISRQGIDFDSMDGLPVNLIILVVAGNNQHREYLGLLSSIMSLLKINNVKDQIIASSSPEDVMKLICEC
jgi:nitrogen PTS system EIIA component